MIIDRRLNQKGTDENIGTSRVNLTQRYVESVKYNGLGDFTEELREEADYRKRIEKIFSEIHMTGETYADLQPEALMEAYWQGEEMISRYYWAKRRDTDDIIWVRVDVRIVPQLDTGDLFAFYNNWDVTHEKNRDRMMQLIIEFDYDYVEYICLQNGHFEIMAQEKSSMCPSARGTDYDADIRDYLTRVAVTDQLEAHIRAMQTEEIRRNLEAEPLYIQEIDVRESDGSVRRKMIRYTYMDKQMETVFKSCVDIEDIVTEEKKKQERLERAIEETERANCAKSEFLAHMSHDIRTPMNAIIGMTSVARQECQDETICGYLDKIKSSSEFLLGLINDMLDISRIESGNLNLKSEQMSREMFGTAINTTIGPLMEQKNITFQCDLQHMEEMIYTDAVRFKQIFFNLLSNAAKYTPEGGNVWLLTERLRTEGNDEWVRFTVRDSGIGMSEEFLEHAFEPFSQEGNRTLALQWQGTGLGLAIVKKLVVMMHGTIEIHSKLGEGTGVILDLPLTISGVDAPEKMPQAVMAKQNLEGRRVLLAEDNEINTFVARRILESKGIIVANKMDMPGAEENLKEFKEKLAANYDEFDELPQIFPISSLAHQGLENLLEATAELLDETDEFLLYSEDDMEQEEVYYGFNEDERPFEISRDDDASWVLSGEKLEKLFVMTNMERDESIMKFARQLRGMGVDEALRERGAKDGDIVRIGNFEFEFVD